MIKNMRSRLRTALVALGVTAAMATPLAASPAGAADAAAGRAAADCSNGYVALTYDDGPNSGTTQSLLNALNAGGAKATFFIWGQRAEQAPNQLRAIQSAGMTIGNHSNTHAHLTQIGESAAYNEIATAQGTIQRITGQTPTLFRPPYGETNARLKAIEARLGLTEVLWTVDSRDWNGAGTAQIVQAASTLQPGGIILMHEGYQSTINAVPQILNNLASRKLCTGKIGFRAVTAKDGSRTTKAVAVAP